MRDTSERREKIASALKRDGSVQVMSLSERFGVSTVSIRKDLKFLESLGVATRTYGGAILNEDENRIVERRLEHKQQLNAKEKNSIGKIAASYVQSGDAIILDSGSTMSQLAAHLEDTPDVTVVSNGLNVINRLSRMKHLVLMMLGGTLRRKNMTFYGPDAEDALRDLHVDTLFLGADGFHLNKGITTHYAPEARLNRLMCEAASRVIVATDSSKFGQICLHRIVDIENISVVVTDSAVPDEYRERLESLDIELVLADSD